MAVREDDVAHHVVERVEGAAALFLGIAALHQGIDHILGQAAGGAAEQLQHGQGEVQSLEVLEIGLPAGRQHGLGRHHLVGGQGGNDAFGHGPSGIQTPIIRPAKPRLK